MRLFDFMNDLKARINISIYITLLSLFIIVFLLFTVILGKTFGASTVSNTDTSPIAQVFYDENGTSIKVTVKSAEAIHIYHNKEKNYWTQVDTNTLTRTFTGLDDEKKYKTREVIIANSSGNISVIRYQLGVDLDGNYDKDLLLAASWHQQLTATDSGFTKNRENVLIKDTALYASNDGSTWKYLGNLPIAMRDPAITYQNGVFYIAGTTGAVRGTVRFTIYKSTDLITWTSEDHKLYEIGSSKFVNSNGTTKKAPLFHSELKKVDSDKYVAEPLMIWGPRWVTLRNEKGVFQNYIIVSITDTTEDYRTHNYWTVYLIPVEFPSATTSVDAHDLIFGDPIPVHTYSSDGKTQLDIKPTNISNDFGRFGGNIYIDSKGDTYLYLKKENTASLGTEHANSKLEVYKADSNNINANTKWIKVADNIKWNKYTNSSLEKRTNCINATTSEFFNHTEGNHVYRINDMRIVKDTVGGEVNNRITNTVLLTDHIMQTEGDKNFFAAFRYNHTMDNFGIWYSNMRTTTTGTSPQPISILNSNKWPSLWKSRYDSTTKIYYTAAKLRNFIPYKVGGDASTDERKVIKKFATNYKFTVSYNNGYKEVQKTISPDFDGNYTVDLGNITVPYTSSFKLTIRSNRASWSDSMIKNGWSIDKNTHTKLTKEFAFYSDTIERSNAKVYLEEWGETKNITFNFKVSRVNVSLYKSSDLNHKTPTSKFVYTGSAIKPIAVVQNKTVVSTEYINNLAVGKAFCKVVLGDGSVVYKPFYIQNQNPKKDSAILLLHNNTATLTWNNNNQTNESTVDGYYVNLKYENNPIGKNGTNFITFDRSASSLRFPTNFNNGKGFNENKLFTLNFSSRKFYGSSSTTYNTSFSDNIASMTFNPKEYSISATASSMTILQNKTLTVTIVPSAIMKTDHEIEYACMYKKSADTKWNMARDYSSNNTCSIKIPDTGTYDILTRARARKREWKNIKVAVDSRINSINVTRDTDNPSLSVITNNNESWTNNNVTLNISSSDSGSGVKNVTVNSKVITLTKGKGSYTISTNGTYVIKATDYANNSTSKVVIVNKIDKVSPELTVNSSERDADGNVIFTIDTNDSGSGIKNVTVNSQNITLTADHSGSYTAKSNGTYTVVATDNVGNITTKKVSVSTIDHDLPNVSVEKSTTAWTSNGVNLHIIATDETTSVKKITVDGLVIPSNYGVADYIANENRQYKVEVYDQVDNKNTVLVNINNIDKTGPTIKLIEGIPTNWTNKSVTVKITLEDLESGIRDAIIDNNKVTLENNSFEFTTDHIKNYTLNVFNNAGILNQQTINVGFIDTESPIIDMQVDGNNIVLNAIDNISGLDDKPYSLDGENWQTTNIIPIVNNKNKYKAYVKDKAGNITAGELNVTDEEFELPQVYVSSKTCGPVEHKSLNIRVIKGNNDLSDENQYEYFLSTELNPDNDNNRQSYESGVNFTIGAGKDDIYYMFVRAVKDKNNNESKKNGTLVNVNGTSYHRFGPYIFDNSAPTCEIEISPKTLNPNVTLTIKASDSMENTSKLLYSWNGTEYFDINSKVVNSNGIYTAFVRDNLGHISSCSRKVDNVGTNESVVNFEPNGTVKYDKNAKTKINVTNINNKILKYKWTTSTEKPSSSEFNSVFNNNDELSVSGKTGRNNYLWIMIADRDGNIEKLVRSNSFYVDNTKPTKPYIDSEIENNSMIDRRVIIHTSGSSAMSGIKKYEYSNNNGSTWNTYDSNKGIVLEEIGENRVITRAISNTGLVSDTSDPFVVNINYTPMNLTITKSTEGKTKNNVEVNITSLDSELLEIEGWNLSPDNHTLVKNYSINTTELVEVKDRYGNISRQTIVIDNIDIEKPKLSVEYDKYDSYVVVKIIANEEIKRLDGFSLSDDNKVLTKIYYSNEDEDVIISDLAGNENTIKILINDIKNSDFDVEVDYKQLNTGKVVVTLSSSAKLQNIPGWTYVEDDYDDENIADVDNKKRYIKTYDKDVDEKIKVIDIDGNERTIKLLYNSKIYDFNLDLKYSKTTLTNENVVVTISSDYYALSELPEWNLSYDKLSISKVYTKNTKDKITVLSDAGYEKTVNIDINNIDKESATLLNYETNKTYQKLYLYFSEPVKEVVVVKDGRDLEYDLNSDTVYTEEGIYYIKITDEAGNVSSYNIKIAKEGQIVKVPNTIVRRRISYLIFGIIEILFGVFIIIRIIKFRNNK